MAKQAVRDAVQARLTANFTLAPILVINQDMTYPQDNSPWVRLEFPVANDIMAAVSSNNREEGTFRIVVATEIVSGITKSQTWCESISTIFNRQRFGGVTCFAPTIREGVDEGLYLVAAVLVPYIYDYLT